MTSRAIRWTSGCVGLAQFLPPLLLVLVTGLAADKFNRRLIMGLCLALEALCALAFMVFTWSNPTTVLPVFGILVVLGIARAFLNPASDALAPNLLPKEAIAAWHLAQLDGMADRQHRGACGGRLALRHRRHDRLWRGPGADRACRRCW